MFLRFLCLVFFVNCVNAGDISRHEVRGYGREYIDHCDKCQNGATCIDTQGHHKCICPYGFTGHDCSENINDCVGAVCLNGGICQDQVGYFSCQCPPGKTGVICHLDDACTLIAMSTCGEREICETNPVDGSYHCECSPGFKGNSCTEDIDECLDSSPCENGGTCVNTLGSFRCQCEQDFTGRRCEINYVKECGSNCQPASSKSSKITPPSITRYQLLLLLSLSVIHVTTF